MGGTLDPCAELDTARNRRVVRLPEEMVHKGLCLALIPMTAGVDCIRPDQNPCPDSLFDCRFVTIDNSYSARMNALAISSALTRRESL